MNPWFESQEKVFDNFSVNFQLKKKKKKIHPL